MIHIDFETRSKVDLWKAGVWKYSVDPSTSILCMAFALDDEEIKLWTSQLDYFMDAQVIFKKNIDEGGLFEAHNSIFELAIYENILVKQFSFPPIPRDRWSCTAAKASAHALPRSLANVGAALNLDIQKDEDGRRVMLKLAKPRTPTKGDSSEWHSNAKDLSALYDYCMADVATERCLSARLRGIDEKERKVWLLDQKINLRGVRVDRKAVECALSHAEEYSERFGPDIIRLTDGFIAKATQSTKMKEWINEKGVEIDNVQKQTVENILKKGGLPDDVRQVLEIRQKLSKSSLAKYRTMLLAMDDDDRMRGLLMYHGAATGRWTGKTFQPQNLPKNLFKGDVEEYFKILKLGKLSVFEMCYPDVMDTLSYNIRGCLIPSEGMDFYGGDYASIEARVLLWYAGDKNALDIFRSGGDIYVDLAKYIYPGQEITKERRQLGKQGVLGCGYGMGAVKFQTTCASYDLIIDEKLAKVVVDAYRHKYVRVVDFWKVQELASMQAVETKKFVQAGKLGWGIDNGFLFCRLPSGRCLAYFHPKIMPVETPWGEMKPALTYMHVNAVTKKWERTSTYGGKIAENVTQAAARDILAYAALECEKRGYSIVLSVHDELITESTTGSVVGFEACMRLREEWAQDIPVEVEGWTGKRYLK